MIVALIDNHGKMAHVVFVIVIYGNAQTVYTLCTFDMKRHVYLMCICSVGIMLWNSNLKLKIISKYGYLQTDQCQKIYDWTGVRYSV